MCSNDLIKDRLFRLNKDLISVEEDGSLKIKCKTCNNIYFVKSIKNVSGFGCKKCPVQNFSKNDVLLQASSLGYTILDDVFSYKCPSKIKCNICGKEKQLSRIINLFISPEHNCCNKKQIQYKRSNENLTIDYINDLCKKQNITLLSNEIRFKKDFYRFKCNRDHEYEISISTLMNRIKNGTNGCNQCAIENQRLNVQDIINVYRDLDLTLLDTNYTNIKLKLSTKCNKCNYIWQPSIESIFYKKSGCPKCNMYLNEKLTGKYLKEILPDINIISQYNINQQIIDNEVKIRNYIIIDYMLKLNNNIVFIEVNGTQHYQPINFNNKSDEDARLSFEHQVIRDRWLRDYCKLNNIILIEIDLRKYKKEEIKKYLQNMLLNITN